MTKYFVGLLQCFNEYAEECGLKKGSELVWVPDGWSARGRKPQSEQDIVICGCATSPDKLRAIEILERAAAGIEGKTSLRHDYGGSK